MDLNLDPTGHTPQTLVELFNQALGGYDRAMGIRFVSVREEELVAELEVRPVHHQPWGLVHGGVYAGVVETMASMGAAMHAARRGGAVVGLENHTSFLKATREGTLTATAKPLSLGNRSQVWECVITDDRARTVATGRVRLMTLAEGLRPSESNRPLKAG